jgi:hypothetical protein
MLEEEVELLILENLLVQGDLVEEVLEEMHLDIQEEYQALLTLDQVEEVMEVMVVKELLF